MPKRTIYHRLKQVLNRRKGKSEREREQEMVRAFNVLQADCVISNRTSFFRKYPFHAFHYIAVTLHLMIASIVPLLVGKISQYSFLGIGAAHIGLGYADPSHINAMNMCGFFININSLLGLHRSSNIASWLLLRFGSTFLQIKYEKLCLY